MKNLDFVTARFTDNDRKTILSTWTDGTRVVETYCEAADRDAQYRDLIANHCTLDQIHENTWTWIGRSREEIDDYIISIGKKRGMITSVGDGLTGDVWHLITKALFTEDVDKEQLFLLKLELFELDFIKACKDRGLKSKLRKAKTVLESISLATEIRNTKEEEPAPKKKAPAKKRKPRASNRVSD